MCADGISVVSESGDGRAEYAADEMRALAEIEKVFCDGDISLISATETGYENIGKTLALLKNENVNVKTVQFDSAERFFTVGVGGDDYGLAVRLIYRALKTDF